MTTTPTSTINFPLQFNGTCYIDDESEECRQIVFEKKLELVLDASTVLPMDCVRIILSFLHPIKDTKGLHKYGYPEIPIYPYIKQLKFAVKDAYEDYCHDVDRDNENILEVDGRFAVYNYIETCTKDEFTGEILLWYMRKICGWGDVRESSTGTWELWDKYFIYDIEYETETEDDEED